MHLTLSIAFDCVICGASKVLIRHYLVLYGSGSVSFSNNQQVSREMHSQLRVKRTGSTVKNQTSSSLVLALLFMKREEFSRRYCQWQRPSKTPSRLESVAMQHFWAVPKVHVRFLHDGEVQTSIYPRLSLTFPSTSTGLLKPDMYVSSKSN